MKLQRTKNATRNIIFGTLLKVYQILIPFAMRTIMVYFLGVEYLGLNSLFTSILSVLSLAELGVGSALVFSMYKPIAEDDEKTICALMRLYKIYYRVIGLIVLIMGLVITPILPYLVKGEIPSELNLYVLYYLNLLATVLSYWLFAYKNSLLTAHQRIDVSSKITLVMSTMTYIAQIIVLIILRNYYFYIIITLISQVLINIITAIVVSKMYPDYNADGNLDKDVIKEINGKVKDLFTAKLGGVITNSADTIVISSFLGLTVLAIYNNYFYIVSSIIGFATIGYNSLMAGIGNSLVTESKEKNYKDFETIVFITVGGISVCTACFLNLFQPFMKIWMGEKLMLSMSVVICFCLYFIIYEINAVLNLFKDAAGMWHQDRFRPLVVSMTNLVLNLLTVKYWGIYGVLLSTVISMLVIGIPWILNNLFNNLFNKNNLNYFFKKLMIYVLEIIAISVVSYAVCSIINIEGIIGLMIKLIICIIISIILFLLFNFKKNEFGSAKLLLKKIIGK